MSHLQYPCFTNAILAESSNVDKALAVFVVDAEPKSAYCAANVNEKALAVLKAGRTY
jgi:hypothetical protein